MLSVEQLSVSYGGIKALRDVTLKHEPGQLVTIIGSNGAGKSTLLNTLAGLVQTQSGQVLFNEQSLNGIPPHRRTGLGIMLVPEGRRIFSKFSVLENLMMGVYGQPNRKKLMADRLPFVYYLFPVLQERSRQLGGTLSGGEQQMLAIARALMAQPKMLMLDEPSMGLAPIFQKSVRDVLLQLKQQGMNILLVEQNAALALGVADYVYLLEVGEIIEHGPVEKMRCSPRVQEAFLGG
ncbi:MAG: ABC transporter ATP-binding protein [Anaerolineales bacterium]|nr:ABC transporter ATP-binding protein [Anaerolineales bacterium]